MEKILTFFRLISSKNREIIFRQFLNSEGHEQVEGEVLLQQVCGFNLEAKTVAQAIKRQITKHEFGFSPLEAMGQKQLVAPVQAITFTPTQLGQMMTPAQGPRQVNKSLESAGLQIKLTNQWVPTDRGQPYCEILDTGKSHNSGTPVKQVKWFQSVLDLLGPGNKPESINRLIDQEALPADPLVVGGAADNEPVQRKQKLKRNRYELDDYFSLVELGEFIGRSRQYVAEVLEKQLIIKWTGQGKRGKYLFTERGWQYGLMYDPSEVTFHNRNSKRLITSNAQPVLGYDILKFFLIGESMNTEFALLAQYNKAFIPLEQICQEFFNLAEKQARYMASKGQLPIPVMRGSSSQQSPYLVKVTDLAEYLDKQYSAYRDDWELLQK